VYIYLAESSVERGQYSCLSQEGYTSSLYAYGGGRRVILSFEKYWNELLKIYLAGLPSSNVGIQSQILPEIECQLATYAHKHECDAKERVFKEMQIHLTDTTARLQGEQSVVAR